jgi:hypothetical protein
VPGTVGGPLAAAARRLRERAEPHAGTIALLTGFVLLRLWAYSSVSPAPAADTGTYFLAAEPSVFDPDFYTANRPFFLPLLYDLLGSNGWRVAAQCLIGTVSWGVLAVVVSREMRTRAMRYVALGAILVFALTPAVLAWDGVLLSESVSFSLSVLLLACLAVAIRRPTTPALVLTGAVATAWVFTRDANALILALLVLPVAVVLAVRGSRRRAAVLAGMAVLLVLLSSASVNAGKRWEFNMLNNIGVRVLPDPTERAYFADHGMPVTPDVVALSGQYASGRDYAFYKIKPLMEWMRKHGRSTYGRYLATHPRYALRSAWGQREVILTSKVPDLLPDRESGYRQALPSPVSNAVYPPRLPGLIVWSVVVLLGGAAVALRYGWDLRWAVPLVLVVSSVPHALLVFHADAMEVGRHSVEVAFMYRLGLLWLAVVAIDRLVTARRPDPPRTPVRTAGKPAGQR